MPGEHTSLVAPDGGLKESVERLEALHAYDDSKILCQLAELNRDQPSGLAICGALGPA
jgi:hypothetical protein